MTGRQAELLNDTQVKACLGWCDERRRYPHRDRVVVLLSVRAGCARWKSRGSGANM